MSAPFAPSYIDALFERQDATAMHALIAVRARHAVLPDECALFTRVLEWLGSDWQYYDALREADFAEVCRLLEKFGMTDVLAKYREGRSASLSQWFDSHESEVRERLFRLLGHASEFLKKNEG